MQYMYRDLAAKLKGAARIRQFIFNAGWDAACGHYLEKPKPPYQRPDYRAIWQAGFDNAERNINEALAELATIDMSAPNWWQWKRR